MGREIVRLLGARGTHAVRVLTRDPMKAAVLASTQVEIIAGEISNASSLAGAMRNVERALVIPPNLYDQAEVEGLIYRTARRVGVSHVLKLSTVKADVSSSCRFFNQHAIAEEYLKGSGMGATILRSNSLMQNLRWFTHEIKSRSTISLPMGDAKTAPVDLRDLAAVSVAVLSGKTRDGVTYNITGSEKLSFAEIAKELSKAIGKEVKYRDVEPAQFFNTLIRSGVPSWYAKAVAAAWAVAREGSPQITDVVLKVAKKNPITFEQFTRDYADAFVC